MNTHLEYKSFNSDKSIEELQYNMKKHLEKLQSIKEDLFFLHFLTKAQIYKSNMLNLFENLEQFKKELSKHIKTCDKLLIDANFQTSQITNKIECDELACDNYFINTHNDLEQKIHQFISQISKYKIDIINYFQSVIQRE